MKEIIFVINESPEGSFEARALGFSIFTEGERLEEIMLQIRTALDCHFGDDI